jgi:hypothetical protein
LALVSYGMQPADRGTQGHNSDSRAGSGSDDGGPLRDVIVAPIESNIDYGPPCDPQC